MPMSRYEIRNEYSLADPELYRAADKDDPEALLEGVAMAGLVGVLRQLGDLAEFAAEIFHNLHEEVMATAARGHGLTIRVQQLETEIPSIERAFLSQTDHSSFFYHAGVDWHPNLRLDQNLVTQEDLPRFIMDSYEECRAPPRLFLLDKFDVAGAGACLKRYTDPSFFKVETSEMTSADVQREKKIRKAKKKGPRWRNEGTPEVLPTSHAKLHQLFLEERVENGVSNPSIRAKLKRRLNGFPFDSKTGKSYMEKLLRSRSPDHKVTVNSSPLMSANDHKESGFEIFEARPVGPDRASGGRKRSHPSSLDGKEIMLNPPMYKPNEHSIDDKLCQVPNSYASIATDGISSSLDKVTGEKVVAMDAESNREGSFTGYQSDDIASEIENYVDAPSTMESEMDGDSELRLKSDITSSHNKSESLISDADDEHLRTRSPDSQSTGDSSISDEGNNSSTKEISSFSSDSPSTSGENPQAGDFSAEGFQCADVPVNEVVDASSYQKTADEDFQVDNHSKPVVSDDTCIKADAITNHRSEFEQLTSSLCSDRSIPTSAPSDSEEVVRKYMLNSPESDETVSTIEDEGKKTNLIIDPPCPPILCGFTSQTEDNPPGSTAGKDLVDEPNGESLPCLSTIPDIHCDTIDSSVKRSSDFLLEDESDGKDRNLVDDIASTLDMLNVISTNGTPETISSENLIPSKLEDDFLEVPENSPDDYSDTAHNGDNIESVLSKEDNIIDVLNDKDSNGSTDSPNQFPCIMEASLGKNQEETSLSNAQTVNVEDNHSDSSIDNQTSKDDLKLPHLAGSADRPMDGLDAHERDVIPKEETKFDETVALETPEPCEVMGLQGTGMTQHVSSNDSEALESSCHAPEYLEEPTGTADTVEMYGISLCLSSSGQEVTEMSGFADLKSVNEVRVQLDKSDSEAEESNTTDIAFAVPAVSDNVSLNKLVEEHNNCFEDSGVDELENDENRPAECPRESDTVEKVVSTEASTSGSETAFCNAVNNDYPKSEILGIIANSRLDLEVDHGMEFVHAATIESTAEQCGLDREQELLNQSGSGNHVTDPPLLLVDYDAKELIAREIIGLPLSQLDQELLLPGETSLELSPSLPINHQQALDHDECKQDNGSASSALSLVDCRSPPSFPELPRPSNHEIDVLGYPKDPLGSIFPPSNPFSETNQINLADLPPLPPLPPVEWRMGKLLQALSSTEGETMRHKKLFPQLISPVTVPPDDVGSAPPPTASTNDDVGSSPPTASPNDIGRPPAASANDIGHPPTASANDIGPSLEKMKHSQIEIVKEIASKEENVENSYSSLEANTLHETADLPPKIENKHLEIVMPISESGVNDIGPPPTASANDIGPSLEKTKRSQNEIAKETAPKEEKVETSCSSSEANALHETADLPPKIENKKQEIVMPISESAANDIGPPRTASASDIGPSLEKTKHSQIEIAKETAPKEENVENSCSSSEANALHETADLPPKIENKHQQLAMPISESVFASPPEEDGVENGSRAVKLPRPRNPLVDNVSVLDKSKLRKVTERVRPAIQKVDERDSLLEQIRTKSFNLKPAMASRPITRGPNTNLNVAAILEKANAIRQAFAGSDEDDSDSWSDS